MRAILRPAPAPDLETRIRTLSFSITQACAQAQTRAEQRPLSALFGSRPGAVTARARLAYTPARATSPQTWRTALERPSLPVLTLLCLVPALALPALVAGTVASWRTEEGPRETGAGPPPQVLRAEADLPILPDLAAPTPTLAHDTARALNAAIAFETGPVAPARPFHLAGTDESRARAVDCLASAQYYEAGADLEGQRAVAQVVLNRVRHPAYPASVCGTVYQGAERRTGCQFSFTCDGALARVPDRRVWEQARELARAALDGAVYSKVGWATHYHTDWVHPVWSAQLRKIAQVRTHLFFRWPGPWGSARAFTQAASLAEPVEPRLARYSPAHRSLPLSDTLAALPAWDGRASDDIRIMAASSPQDYPDPARAGLAGINLRGAILALAHPQGDAFGLLLAQGESSSDPDSMRRLIREICAGRNFCKVMAWTDAQAIPPGFPVPRASRQRMAFLYVRDAASGQEISGWNCALLSRRDPADCLAPGATRWDAIAAK